jgi:TPR repeat protein
LSVPIFDFAIENEVLAAKATGLYYQCCGKSICAGCVHSFNQTGNDDKCAFCNADRNKTLEEQNADMMKRVEANDPASICMLANSYHNGYHGLQQDHAKSMELFTKSAELGCSMAHYYLATIYDEGGNLKKAKFHYEAAAMAGHEVARFNLGCFEAQSRNIERALKHWTIAASAGHYTAMHNLLIALKNHDISRESMDSTLEAYNNSCAEVRSEARDAYIRVVMGNE